MLCEEIYMLDEDFGMLDDFFPHFCVLILFFTFNGFHLAFAPIFARRLNLPGIQPMPNNVAHASTSLYANPSRCLSAIICSGVQSPLSILGQVKIWTQECCRSKGSRRISRHHCRNSVKNRIRIFSVLALAIFSPIILRKKTLNGIGHSGGFAGISRQ